MNKRVIASPRDLRLTCKYLRPGEILRVLQDSVLEQVCTDLAYRPRLPLEARLQAPVFVEGVNSRCVLLPLVGINVERRLTA